MIFLFPDYKLPTLFSYARSLPLLLLRAVLCSGLSFQSLHLNTFPVLTFKKPGTRLSTNHKAVVQPRHAHTHTHALRRSLHYFITLICLFLFSRFTPGGWLAARRGYGWAVGQLIKQLFQSSFMASHQREREREEGEIYDFIPQLIMDKSLMRHTFSPFDPNERILLCL